MNDGTFEWALRSSPEAAAGREAEEGRKLTIDHAVELALGLLG